MRFPSPFKDELDVFVFFALSITAVLVLALVWNHNAVPPTPMVSMVNIGILVTVTFASWAAVAVLIAVDDWLCRRSAKEAKEE